MRIIVIAFLAILINAFGINSQTYAQTINNTTPSQDRPVTEESSFDRFEIESTQKKELESKKFQQFIVTAIVLCSLVLVGLVILSIKKAERRKK